MILLFDLYNPVLLFIYSTYIYIYIQIQVVSQICLTQKLGNIWSAIFEMVRIKIRDTEIPFPVDDGMGKLKNLSAKHVSLIA